MDRRESSPDGGREIYDFETVIDRRGTGAVKWDLMREADGIVPEGTVPFSVADMEFKNPPEIIRGLKEYLGRAVLGYTQGTDGFYEAVTGWTKRRYGWETRREWLVTTPGVVNAFFHGVRTFTEPGDGVILLTPVYYPFYNAAKRNGRVIERCPLILKDGAYAIDFELLEQLAKKPGNRLLILSNPHNPVGRVWTREELTRLGEICLRHQVFVTADEIHCDLIMPGHTFTSFASISPEFEANSMTCIAPSKTFNLAGMQASCIFIPDPGRRKAFIYETGACGQENRLGILSYESTRIAYTQCDRWLEKLIEAIDGNRLALKAFLAERCPGVLAADMEGTYLQWMDVRILGLSPREQERVMIQEGRLFFDEGSLFGPEGDGFERMNLACPRSVLMAALERFESVYRRYAHKK